ncbi:MAG: NAD(P)H-dependent oxidoreductase [Bacteroidota bacterium]
MITIICSTNRNNSVTRKISLIYQQMLADRSIATDIIDLGDLPEDFIASALYENSGKNETFNPVRKRMKESEKYIFIIPEYNGSFPGVLKTFIDGLEFPGTFKGKKAALVGLSSGVQGGGLALSHLTDILNYCGTSVLALKPKLSRIGSAMDGDEITNPVYNELLKEQVEALLQF